MQHDVEALTLLVGGDAQATREQAHDLEDDEGDNGAVGDGDDDAIELRANLAELPSIQPTGVSEPVTAWVANTPVRIAPTMPPMPWTPKASSESS